MESDSEFEIQQSHLNKMLNYTLNGNLTYDNLKTTAFGLMFSEYFSWDSETEIRNRMATIILELDNTKIKFSNHKREPTIMERIFGKWNSQTEKKIKTRYNTIY